MEISALKLALLLLTVGGTLSSAPTYQRTDQGTGRVVTCQRCPPGTYVAKHCTSSSGTVCQPCPDQHYTSLWNYVERCRFCNVICEDREQVKNECNATQNRVCECKPGYFQGPLYCIKDCSTQTDPDSACDTEVIEFVVGLNLSARSFRRLLKASLDKDIAGRKNVTGRKVRILLTQIKNTDPDHPLLPRLIELVKEANITHLEKELRKRFIKHEDARHALS